jgi:hypothetical protein
LRKLIGKLQKLNEKIEQQECLENDELSNDLELDNISEGKFKTTHRYFNWFPAHLDAVKMTNKTHCPMAECPIFSCDYRVKNKKQYFSFEIK